MSKKKSQVSLDGNNNIVIQNVRNSTITIQQNDPKLEEKLKQLPPEVKKQVAELRGLKFDLPKPLTPRIERLAASQIVGREEALKELRQNLEQQSATVVMNGMGGIGKTTLAKVYVDTYYEDYAHLIWLSQSDTEQDITTTFAAATELRKNLGIAPEITDSKDAFLAIVNKLNTLSAKPNLLVIDNANRSLEGVRHQLPDASKWHCLLTSRVALNGFTCQPLDFLSPEDALKLFEKHYTIGVLTEEQIKSLLKTLDYHTLAIELVAKTAEVYEYSFEELKRALPDDIETELDDVVHAESGQIIERITSYLRSIFRLVDLSEDELWLLKNMACLPAQHVPYSTLKSLLVEPDYKKLRVLLRKLAKKGWLLRGGEEAGETYKMHGVIGEVLRQEMDMSFKDIQKLTDSVIQRLNMDGVLDNPTDKFEWIPFGEALSVVIKQMREIEVKGECGALENYLGFVMLHSGRYKRAEQLLKSALILVQKRYGAEHPNTATVYCNLGFLYQDLGALREARLTFEKAKSLMIRAYGANHQKMGGLYAGLGMVLMDLGAYEEAKILIKKALNIDEKTLGLSHPSTALKYSKLGVVLMELDDYKLAEIYLQKSIDIAKRHFGDEHPNTISKYSNLASLFKKVGCFKKAEEIFRRVSNANELNYGEYHPITATGYSNLGGALLDLGDYKNAKGFLERALFIDKKIFGENNLRIAMRYTNLANNLFKLRYFEESVSLSEKAIEILKKKGESNSPQIASVYSVRGLSLQALGNFLEANRDLRLAKDISLLVFGEFHSKVGERYMNLATSFFYLKKLRKALSCAEKSLNILQKTLPAGHPNIETVRSWYYGILQHLKKS